MKHLVEIKSQFPCGILFLHLAQKQVQIWRRCVSFLRSPNFAQRNTIVYKYRINWHFEFWKKKNWKWNFNHWEIRVHHSAEQNSFIYIQLAKIAFFLLSVWLVGQSGWKLCSRPGTQGLIPGSSKLSQKSVVGQFYFLKTWNFNPSFNWTYLTASFCFPSSRFSESSVVAFLSDLKMTGKPAGSQLWSE